jgi:hypothetical protein
MMTEGLHLAKDCLLQVSVDPSWEYDDTASLVGKTWTPHLGLKNAEEMFTKVLRPINEASSTLSTHSNRSDPYELRTVQPRLSGLFIPLWISSIIF